jgi:hypothetical protein
MPEFDIRIQNLIASMLTVDVNKRIALPRIKEHPAFLLDVENASYCCPTPWPVPVSSDPIQISRGDAALQLMRSFGYQSDVEILEGLQSKRDTTAKPMWNLVNRDPASNRRWGPAAGASNEPIVLSADVIVDETPETEPKDPFYRWPQTIDKPSFEAYSMAKPTELPSVTDADEPVIFRRFQQKGKLENLVGALQEMLAARGFQWIYTNPRNIFAKNFDNGFELEFRIEYKAVGQLLVTVTLVEGDEDLFERVVSDIEVYLNALKF